MAPYFENGIFTDNQPAWHGAGIVSKKQYLTKQEIFEAVPEIASPVVKCPVYASYIDLDGNPGVSEGINAEGEQVMFANVRQMDGRMLGAGLGKGYTLVQNDELFDLAEAIVEQGGVWKTAGTLRDGQVVWGMLEIPEAAKVAGEDYQRNLFVTNSFDGSMGLRIATCATRIVCANTLAIASREAKRQINVKHTSGARALLYEAKSALQLAYRSHEHLAAIAEQLAAVKVTPAGLGKFLDRLVPYTPESQVSDVSKRNIDDRRSDVLNVIRTSPNLDHLRGTAWGVVHGVTEWEQHYAYTRRTAEQKLRAVVFDDDLPYTKVALAWAKDLAGVGA